MLRLVVHRQAWLQHVSGVAADYGPGLVPVVKGNGYGFGRPLLHDLVAHNRLDGADVAGDVVRADAVCVGSVSELHDVPAALVPVVLTPAAAPPRHRVDDAVLTVGAPEHVEALHGWRGRVMVKLVSTMRRYGTDPEHLPALLEHVHAAGLEVAAFALHLAHMGTERMRIAEIEAWTAHLDALAPADRAHPLWVSHLEPDNFHRLRDRHPERDVRIRVGTALWHGVPRRDFLRLEGVVMQTREVHAGASIGYRDEVAPADGTVVCVAVGSAHGVRVLDHPDPTRRSPFHHARRRLTLVERPYMHTSLCFVPDGQPCPNSGEAVDVQQPLIDVHCDTIDWRP